MTILEKDLRKIEKIDNWKFSNKIVSNTADNLADTFDEEGKKIMESIWLEEDYIALASKLMSKDIAEIITVIWVMKIREWDEEFNKRLSEWRNSIIFSILKENILESWLLYIGFSQEMIDTYLGDETIVRKPIDPKAILKIIEMSERGTLKLFQELKLLQFDSIWKIWKISDEVIFDIKQTLPKIISMEKKFNTKIDLDFIIKEEKYYNKHIKEKDESYDGLEKAYAFQNDFRDKIDALSSKLEILKSLWLDVNFYNIKWLVVLENEKKRWEIEKGIDSIIGMKSQIQKLTKFGFRVELGDIPWYADEFSWAQISHIVLLLPKLKKLGTYKWEDNLKIRISLDDIISSGSKLSEDLLDKLIVKKEFFILFFYMINQKVVSLNHIVDLEYMIIDEKALERYIKLTKAWVRIANFQLKNSKQILTEFSDQVLDDACRLASMWIVIKIDEIETLLHIDYNIFKTIYTHEESIKTWLGADKIIENNSNRPMAASTSHNYRLNAFSNNSGEYTNLKRLSKICSFPHFPEFAVKYKSFQLWVLDIEPKYINWLLEKNKKNPEDLYNFLEKLRDSNESNSIKKDFIKAIFDDSKAYYNLPETTSDELFIAKQITSNRDTIPESIVLLEDLWYDTGRNSGTYFACLRKLKDNNAWHKYEYAEYLYDTADIDDNWFTDENWIELLGLYSILDVDEGIHLELKENLDKIIPTNDIENKNFIFAKLREVLNKLLDSGLDSLSREEKMIIDIIYTNGAGNLSYVEGLNNFIYQLIQVFQSEKAVPKTIEELKYGIKDIGNTLSRKWWDDADTVDFWNIWTDILESAPSLYSTYLDLFKELTPKQLKEFYRDIYSYYHIELILHQQIDRDGDFSYNPRELVSMRKNIKKLIINLKDTKNPSAILKKEKERIQENIEKQFQLRFGIKKIPNIITAEHMQSIKNHTLYLANIKGLDDEKETLIWFFLTLKLNSVWNDFREWKDIDIREYMIDDKIYFLEHYMKERKKNSINLDIEGLSEDFTKSLQEETIAESVGDVDDIDVRLLSIQSNIIELLDDDIYQWENKIILHLLNMFGKTVWKALAMKFRELDGKGELWIEDDIIIDSLWKELSIDTWTIEDVKRLQLTLKSISPITNFVQKIKKIGLDGEVSILQNAKIPSEEIIAIFHKLWENFSSESGVRVISNDVQYLRIIIAKWEEKLTKEEKELATKYLDNTESHILKLESIKDDIERLFDNMYQQLKNTKNNILKDRLDALKEIVYQSVWGKKLIISKMTSDLDTVITNIRACLSCQKKECNNDTNLAFGDENRFFLTSYSGSIEKSFSDQLVTLLETKEWPMFVMDLMYGERVPDVFLAHILCVFKKLKILETEKISIFVPSSAARWCHLTEENMKKQLKEQLWDGFEIRKEEKLEISIWKSASGDSYHEFENSNCREVGEKTVKGFVISKI